MKLSARNQLVGTIKTIKPGATTTHVTIEIAPSVEGRDEGYGCHQGVQRHDRCGLSPRLGGHSPLSQVELRRASLIG